MAAYAYVQVYGLLERGAMQRATGTTKMNELSSRSHAVFIIIIEKSTVTSMQEADGDEMEQFRGLAPGSMPLSNPTTHFTCTSVNGCSACKRPCRRDVLYLNDNAS